MLLTRRVPVPNMALMTDLSSSPSLLYRILSNLRIPLMLSIIAENASDEHEEGKNGLRSGCNGLQVSIKITNRTYAGYGEVIAT